MKRIILALISCAALQAATIQLGIDDNEGNGSLTTRTYNVAGIGLVTVTAFTNTIEDPDVWSQSATTQFGVAQGIGPFQQNLGLGICNAIETSSGGCGGGNPPEWQIDSADEGSDYVLISFPTLVDNVMLRIHQTSGTRDADVAWATTISDELVTTLNIHSLLGQNLASQYFVELLTGTGVFNSTSNWEFRDFAIGNGVRQLLFGVAAGHNNDFFKLLSVSADASAVPEPGSMALLGSGLLALGYFSRRRKKQ